jgi:hypothetical protein
MGISQLLSVPYALYAEKSGNKVKSSISWTDTPDATYLTNYKGSVGIGIADPESKVHIYGGNADFRLQKNSDSSSYFEIFDGGPAYTHINKISESGGCRINISPKPLDGTSGAWVRLFRHTNTNAAVGYEALWCNSVGLRNTPVGIK